MPRGTSTKNGDTVCGLLRHPIRVRILEVANERTISPIQFCREGLMPEIAGVVAERSTLHSVSYHFRELEKYGCLEVVDTRPVRGSVEHFFRGIERVDYTPAEWAALTDGEKSDISRTGLQGLFARADSAVNAGTFDSRDDRHLSWLSMNIDSAGFFALNEALDEALEAARRIAVESAERVAADPSTPTIPATFGALGFESPPIP